MKKEKVFEMTPEQIETSIRHSKNNIIRSVVLLKRAVNTLTFADRSLQGTEELSTTEDICVAKRSIGSVIEKLEKYAER